MASSLERRKNNGDLFLEEDLVLSPEDIEAMNRKAHEPDRDLSGYLDFLEDIGAFDSPQRKKIFYEDEFSL